MDLKPSHSVTDDWPSDDMLSPSVITKFSNISFQKTPQTQIFTNNTTTNTDASQRAQSLPDNTFTNCKPSNNQLTASQFASQHVPQFASQNGSQSGSPSSNKLLLSQSASQNMSQLHSDYSSSNIQNAAISQTEDTNQENINPNPISTSNEHSPKQTAANTTNIQQESNASSPKEPPTKSKSAWKQAFNKLIREAKAFESSKEHLSALQTYIKASKLSPKRHKKLQDKIERVQDRCYELELHETEEAFEQIEAGPWYLNIVTDNYHIERESKDEHQDEEEWNEDEEEAEYVLPADIYDKLYDYQRQALAWFWKIYQSPNGGILGDDMGLGKTVQMCAFLNGAFQSGLVKSCILIVPVSVMTHWIKELQKWCDVPGFRIRKYHSSFTKKRRREHLETIAKRGGILITTYGMVQKNFASMRIEEITKKVRDGKVVKEGRMWDYMILDEGHKIKNHLIGTSKAVRQIPVKNSNKIILSGTFLQNELSELWSLFDFISEGALFGSYRAFNEEFATKINAGRLKNASLIQKQISNQLLNLIKKTVKPYLLRRTKVEIRQKQQDKMKENEKNGVISGNKKKLAPLLQCQKRELAVWITMSSIQVELYRTFLESEAVKETLNTTKSPLAALTVLKKICDHPFLISDKMANCSELTQLSEVTKDRSIQNTLATSHKMGVLLSLLTHLIDNKHRILVFSQYKIILSMIEPIMKENKIQYLRMDGDTPIDSRQQFVDAFNKRTELQVFLLSTRVGGLGLNLVGSDRVIIYDPAWNPATDAQAVDRSYRIGQINDVMVYRFVTCGTIEEKIYRRQISKVGLLKSVTGQTNQHRYFSKAELKEVFKLENPESSQTQIQFKELHAHRIGTNAAFDTETDHVEHIQHVYGISHHDLLFRTCPAEELEENPELAQQMEEYQKKLKLQTPRTARKKKPKAHQQKITDILEGNLDLRKNNKNHNKNNKNENKWLSMDIDDDDEEEEDELSDMTRRDMANVSFISNVSSIHPNARNEDQNVSWIDNKSQHTYDSYSPIPTSTTKKTRTLRKKQNQFIADSDSDYSAPNDTGFNVFPRNKPQFDFSSSTKIKSKPISNNVILQSPIFRRFQQNEIEQNEEAHKASSNPEDIMEDHGIDMTDVVKAIRSQPRRKRRKSIANLKRLLGEQENDGCGNIDNNNNDNIDNNNNTNTDINNANDNTDIDIDNNANVNNDDDDGVFDSEATVSDTEIVQNVSPQQEINLWQSCTSSRPQTVQSSPMRQPVQNAPVALFSGLKESPISNFNSFIFQNNDCNRYDENVSCDSKVNEFGNPNNPYLDDELINNLQSFSVQQNNSFEQLHQVHDDNSNSNSNNNALNEPHKTTNDAQNVFSFTPNESNISGFAFSQNDSKHNDSNESNVFSPNESNVSLAFAPNNIHSFANQFNENEEYDDEETVSEDEEMLFNNNTLSLNPSTSSETSNECVSRALKAPAASASVTALQLFEEEAIEQKEETAPIEAQIVEQLQSVSPQKVTQVAKRYKRYRRKSFIPQIEEYDNVNEDDEQSQIVLNLTSSNAGVPSLQHSVLANVNNGPMNAVTVCDKHRQRAVGIESFEYNCIKCECYLSENEKNEYHRYIQMADEAERKEDWIICMESTMKALTICNSDPAVHAKCIAIGEQLGMFT